MEFDSSTKLIQQGFESHIHLNLNYFTPEPSGTPCHVLFLLFSTDITWRRVGNRRGIQAKIVKKGNLVSDEGSRVLSVNFLYAWFSGVHKSRRILYLIIIQMMLGSSCFAYYLQFYFLLLAHFNKVDCTVYSMNLSLS